MWNVSENIKWYEFYVLQKSLAITHNALFIIFQRRPSFSLIIFILALNLLRDKKPNEFSVIIQLSHSHIHENTNFILPRVIFGSPEKDKIKPKCNETPKKCVCLNNFFPFFLFFIFVLSYFVFPVVAVARLKNSNMLNIHVFEWKNIQIQQKTK